MKAVVAENGEATVRDVAAPTLRAEQIKIRVKAAGLNRADLLQIAGLYPPPCGESSVLGLECAGVAEDGRRVCALLASGGLAEEVVVDRGSVIDIADAMSFEEAAAIPEAWFTAHDNLFSQAGLQRGERVLIHAGASGVGTAAIQLAHRAGAYVIATSRSPEKLERCRALGADEALQSMAGIEPVDVILDVLGGGALEQNLALLRPHGRLVCIALMQGTTGSLDLARLLRLQLQVIGSVMRTRGIEEKASVVREFAIDAWPDFANGRLRPVIDSTFSFAEIARACARLASNQTVGKVVVVL